MTSSKIILGLLVVALLTISGCFLQFPNRVEDPFFTPSAPAEVDPGSTIQITTSTPGAEIRYTDDGSTPVETSMLYSGPITINDDTTFKAIAYKDGLLPSNVETATYTVTGGGNPTDPGIYRSLSSSTVSPGGTVTVTLTKVVPAGTQSLIIEEYQFSGFVFSNPSCGTVDSNGVLRIGEIEGLSGTPTNGDCTYTATAPSTPGTYNFNGKFTMNTLNNNQELPIVGINSIVVQ